MKHLFLPVCTLGAALSIAGNAADPATTGVDAYDLELRVNQKLLPASDLLSEQPPTNAAIRITSRHAAPPCRNRRPPCATPLRQRRSPF